MEFYSDRSASSTDLVVDTDELGHLGGELVHPMDPPNVPWPVVTGVGAPSPVSAPTSWGTQSAGVPYGAAGASGVSAALLGCLLVLVW